jgi:hypothetical protein
MKKVSRIVRWIQTNSWVHLGVGLILFCSGAFETWQTLAEDFSSFSLGSHHGVTIFGLFTSLRPLPDIL